MGARDPPGGLANCPGASWLGDCRRSFHPGYGAASPGVPPGLLQGQQQH